MAIDNFAEDYARGLQIGNQMRRQAGQNPNGGGNV